MSEQAAPIQEQVPVTVPGTPRAALALAAREVSSFYRLPVGWIVTALYLALTGAAFALDTFEPGAPATLRSFFGMAGLMLMVVAPAISMRLLSEEHRTGTVETLTTAPVTDAAIVLGKYLGALACTALVLAGTLVFPIALTIASSPAPDPGPILLGYLSLLLAAAVYLALGLLISATTSSQTLAYLGALLGLISLQLIAVQAAPLAPAPFDAWLAKLAIVDRVGEFAKGVLDTSHAGFLIALALYLVCLAWVVQGARRWL